MAAVYILKSEKNNTYYTGSTNDFERRIKEHVMGKSRYTRNLLPMKIVFRQEYKFLKSARKVEKWLKKQKNKNLIQKIIKEGRISKQLGP